MYTFPLWMYLWSLSGQIALSIWKTYQSFTIHHSFVNLPSPNTAQKKEYDNNNEMWGEVCEWGQFANIEK
jgi:hypothetical protein